MDQKGQNVMVKILNGMKESIRRLIARYGVEENPSSTKKLQFRHKLGIAGVYYALVRQFQKEYQEPSLSEYKSMAVFVASLCGHCSYYQEKTPKLSTVQLWWTCTGYPHWKTKPCPRPSTRSAFLNDLLRVSKVVLPPRAIIVKRCSSWAKFIKWVKGMEEKYSDSDFDCCDSETTISEDYNLENNQAVKNLDDIMEQLEQLHLACEKMACRLPRHR